MPVVPGVPLPEELDGLKKPLIVALTVTPASLTVTAGNAAKTYDGAAFTGGSSLVFSGFRNDEAADILTGTRAFTGNSQGAINAGSIEADGIDLKLAYRWENDLGRFGVSTDYTHVRQYKLVDVPGLELGLKDIGVFDAAGTTGDDNLVRSLPDNKGNIMFSWNRDAHGVTVTNRHIGSYRDLTYHYAEDFDGDMVLRCLFYATRSSRPPPAARRTTRCATLENISLLENIKNCMVWWGWDGRSLAR